MRGRPVLGPAAQARMITAGREVRGGRGCLALRLPFLLPLQFPCPPPGKSAVINALLGERFLAEGILPTTNEINLLKWADPGAGGESAVQVRARQHLCGPWDPGGPGGAAGAVCSKSPAYG